MVTQTFHVIDSLLSDSGKEGRVDLVSLAGEHEVLPHKNTHLVAIAIESIVLVYASTPHAENIHVHITCILDQTMVDRVGAASKEIVAGHHIGSLGIQGLTVKFKIEVMSPFVLVVMEFQRAYSDTFIVHIGGRTGGERGMERVKVGLAKAIGPP